MFLVKCNSYEYHKPLFSDRSNVTFLCSFAAVVTAVCSFAGNVRLPMYTKDSRLLNVYKSIRVQFRKGSLIYIKDFC